jgi:Cys-tRNA(Pro) deacylase
MTKEKFPVTQAVRVLKAQKADFSLHVYKYEEKGGTAVAARALNVEERWVIKTLVMEDEKRNPILVLMHGDNKVSTKAFARVLGVKTIKPCEPHVAYKHTGYLIGGISPFGIRKPIKICVEETILNLQKIYINAGKRGLLAEISPKDVVRILKPTVVKVAI